MPSEPLSVWRGAPLWVKALNALGIVLVGVMMWLIATDRASDGLGLVLSIVTTLVIASLPVRQLVHDLRRRRQEPPSVNPREPW